jgi:flagellar biosynthetic protein FliR
MITLTSGQLNAWLALLAWPLARILALIASAPITGNQQFPLTAKIGLAVLLTMLVAPTLPAPAALDPASAAGFMLLIRETLIGLGMGFAMRVVFTGVQMAGDVIGLQMGLGFATFYDPQSSAEVPVIGQFLNLLATLAFLSLNGHLMLISTLVDTFHAVPLEAAGTATGTWLLLAQWGGMIMRTAVMLSLPVIATLLVVNAALAVLTRAAPALNIFAIGFPVTILIGFIALLLTLPYCTPIFERIFAQGLETMLRLGAGAS